MSTLSSEQLHASCVSIAGRAVLLSGPSGSGKSDLALRLIDRGAMLVGDDITIVKRDGAQLRATSADRIRGKIEVRGLGLFEMPVEDNVPVAIMIDLKSGIERFPLDQERRSLAGVEIPVVALDAFESSAPIKVEMALDRVMA